MKIVDLSVAIESDLPCDPPDLVPHIDYYDHVRTREEMCGYYGITENELPEKNGWAHEFIQTTAHAGTHVDAPWHYYPTMNGGEPSWTIDEVPLEWFFGNGVVVDLRDKPDGYLVTVKDLEDYFERVNYEIKPGDIVLLMTGADKQWGDVNYLSSGCGMSKEATLWLINKGSKVMGTDAWGWDIPIKVCAEEYKQSQDVEIIWQGHRAGREAAYCHMEKLTNLEKLPLTGFQVVCLPVKIKGGSAGWCRAVALLDE